MSKMSKTIAILGVVAGLGVAALPLSTYAAPIIDGTAPDTTKDGIVSGDTAVKLTISDELSMELSKDTTEGNEVDLADGSAPVPMTVKVITNGSKGYNLNLKGSATTNPTSLTNDDGDQILSAAAKFAAPAPLSNATNSEWGYNVANTNANLSTESAAAIAKFKTGETLNYAGVIAGDGDEIVNATKPTGSAGDTTTVTFAAVIKDGQAAGTYNGKVTFTASNNQ